MDSYLIPLDSKLHGLSTSPPIQVFLPLPKVGGFSVFCPGWLAGSGWMGGGNGRKRKKNLYVCGMWLCVCVSLWISVTYVSVCGVGGCVYVCLRVCGMWLCVHVWGTCVYVFVCILMYMCACVHMMWDEAAVRCTDPQPSAVEAQWQPCPSVGSSYKTACVTLKKGHCLIVEIEKCHVPYVSWGDIFRKTWY